MPASSSSAACDELPTSTLLEARSSSFPQSFNEALVILTHVSFALAACLIIYRLVKREYARAKEGYRRYIEEPTNDNPEDFKQAWGMGESAQLDLGAQVLHPTHGRGVVTSFSSFRREGGGVVVLYEQTGDSRTHVGPDRDLLLTEGHRVVHPQRGAGMVRGFDEMGRVHVEFDSGEYHRYKSADWQKKIRHSSKRLRVKQSSLRQFFYDYLLYRVDYVLSTFAFAKPLLLLMVTYLLIVIGALFYSYGAGISYLEALWVAWTFVADPGAHSDQRGTMRRAIAFSLTVGGMLVFALMIGIIADGVSSVLDGLKQGKSVVIENGHTLILGWSDKTLPLIREIAMANESLGGGVIVVLADRPKAEMELELSKDLSEEEARGTFVVVRQGSPTSQMDLCKVSAGGARSIVVLANTSSMGADESDANALRVVMSLTGIRKPSTGHVVVELSDVDNRDLILLVDPHNVEVVVAHDLIGRAMIQCARQPGLAQILDEILGFDGDEFYVKVFPELAGCTFGEVLFRFPDAIPLGVKPLDRADAHRQILLSTWRIESLRRRGFNGEVVSLDEGTFSLKGGPSMAPVVDHFAEKVEEEQLPAISREVILNPPNDYVIRPGDGILVLAEDDDTFSPRPLAGETAEAFWQMKEAHRPVVMNQPEKFLFCGWRRDMDDMIMELDELVGTGSELTIMCTVPVHERARRMEEGGLNVARLRNITLNHVVGNPILRRDLDKLRLHTFSSVLILADEALETNMSSADSRSLASLFLIRDLIARKNKAQKERPKLTSQRSGADLIKKRVSGDLSVNDKRPARLNSQTSSPDLFSADAENKLQPKASPRESIMTSPTTTSDRAMRVAFAQETLAPLLETQSRGWRPNTLARRQSSVGADLFFENAKDIGRTVIISEILDSRTKALIPVARVSDHVMSNEIVAAALAMVSEDRVINVVLSELLQAEGNDLQIRSALDYGASTEKISFWTLLSRARERGEIALGYKAAGEKNAVLNPRDKNAKFTIGPRATVIVLAED